MNVVVLAGDFPVEDLAGEGPAFDTLELEAGEVVVDVLKADDALMEDVVLDVLDDLGLVGGEPLAAFGVEEELDRCGQVGAGGVVGDVDLAHAAAAQAVAEDPALDGAVAFFEAGDAGG
jgi:hypothetical protein